MTTNSSLRCLIAGIILGFSSFVCWDYLLKNNINNEDKQIQELRTESQEMLLHYIEGKWNSSIGDVQIEFDISKDKDFIVSEYEQGKQTVKKLYLISEMIKVNGLSGVVQFNICPKNSQCTPPDIIQIQINKLFGLRHTIAISYDSRLTYCVDPEKLCTRAFKRQQED